jgi:dipeptidyl aminopeptidase/acylaminoacyl peptidase
MPIHGRATWSSLLYTSLTMTSNQVTGVRGGRAPRRRASAARGFVPQDLWRLRAVSDPQVSPDGEQVAFCVATPDVDNDRLGTVIWVGPVNGSEPPRQFSLGPEDSSPRWSPDGRWLAFVAKRGEATQLHLASLAGGEARAETDSSLAVSQPAWSPDSRRLIFVGKPARPAELEEPGWKGRPAPRVVSGLRSRFDGTGWFDERRSHLFVVDVESGKVSQVTDGDWDDADPAWSPDGRLLAFVSDRSPTRADEEHRDVWVVAANGRRRPRRLTRGRGTASSPVWSPDGSTIAYVGHEHPSGDSASNTHLMVVEAEGPGAPRSISAPMDRPVWGLVRPLGGTHSWSEDGRAVLFLAADRGTIGIYRSPLANPNPTPILAGDRQIVAFHVSGATLAFVAQWPSVLPEVYVASPDGAKERRLSSANAELGSLWVAPVHRIRHRAADGREIESFVLYPRERPRGRPVPTVLEIHGGPHFWNPQGPWLVLYQSLAAAGFAVLLPNPRGSQGYGEEFSKACVGDWGGADFDDLMGAVDFLVQDGVADPQRLYVAGYSYGGFMTSWVVGHTNRFAAACVSAPVTNLTSFWGTTDIPNFLQYELGSAPWERPDEYAKHSPITYLPSITTPVQVFHWEGDLRCPVGQGEELFQGLRKLGRETVMVRYPGGFHVDRSPAAVIDFTRRHLDWFEQHAKEGPSASASPLPSARPPAGRGRRNPRQ